MSNDYAMYPDEIERAEAAPLQGRKMEKSDLKRQEENARRGKSNYAHEQSLLTATYITLVLLIFCAALWLIS